MATNVAPHAVSVGDRIRLDGRIYTVAVSEPCGLNPGGWHLEMEEDDPNAPPGWPYSIRYLSPDAFGAGYTVELCPQNRDEAADHE